MIAASYSPETAASYAPKAWDILADMTPTELALEYEAAFEAAKRAITGSDQQAGHRLLNYCDKILCLRLPLPEMRPGPRAR